MKATFKKVLYGELDIDFQKIYDLIIQKTGKDDFNTLYHQFANNAKSYISETHDLKLLFDKYDLVFLNSDFLDDEDVPESVIDNFHTFLRDKFNI